MNWMMTFPSLSSNHDAKSQSGSGEQRPYQRPATVIFQLVKKMEVLKPAWSLRKSC
jgi:hypothetical protein